MCLMKEGFFLRLRSHFLRIYASQLGRRAEINAKTCSWQMQISNSKVPGWKTESLYFVLRDALPLTPSPAPPSFSPPSLKDLNKCDIDGWKFEFWSAWTVSAWLIVKERLHLIPSLWHFAGNLGTNPFCVKAPISYDQIIFLCAFCVTAVVRLSPEMILWFFLNWIIEVSASPFLLHVFSLASLL